MYVNAQVVVNTKPGSTLLQPLLQTKHTALATPLTRPAKLPSMVWLALLGQCACKAPTQLGVVSALLAAPLA